LRSRGESNSRLKLGELRVEVNQDQVQGLIKQLSGSAKACWGVLTGDPVAIATGTRDRLAGRIQEQRGDSKRAADQQLAEFMHRNRKWSDPSGR
jgi:uncharacterized protein YjbJ (UPF0337 family)